MGYLPPTLEPLVRRMRGLVVDVLGPRAKASHQLQAPRLLHAVLALMDAVKGDAALLLCLARGALDLLALPGIVPLDVGGHGVQSSYLDILKALFKLSKNSGNDAIFREEGLLEVLLELLEQRDRCNSEDLRVYAVGVLKNVSNT